MKQIIQLSLFDTFRNQILDIGTSYSDTLFTLIQQLLSSVLFQKRILTFWLQAKQCRWKETNNVFFSLALVFFLLSKELFHLSSWKFGESAPVQERNDIVFYMYVFWYPTCSCISCTKEVFCFFTSHFPLVCWFVIRMLFVSFTIMADTVRSVSSCNVRFPFTLLIKNGHTLPLA